MGDADKQTMLDDAWNERELPGHLFRVVNLSKGAVENVISIVGYKRGILAALDTLDGTQDTRG